jgi:exonuclease III
MKLICLNVRSGGGNRWDAILKFVDSHRADVVIFTEWRSSEASGRAVSWAASHGMRWLGACDGATRNGAFAASSIKFRSTSATPGPETAGTLMRVEFDRWTLLASYFPQGEAKAKYF